MAESKLRRKERKTEEDMDVISFVITWEWRRKPKSFLKTTE